MKEQDLRDCFGRIVPTEKLISDTVSKIDLMRDREEKRSGFSLGLSHRLASALCALVLVIGLGVVAMRNPEMVPHDTDTAPVARSIGEEDITPTAYTASTDLEDMVERAKAEDGEWIVFVGKVDRYEFTDPTSEERDRGIEYHYSLVLTPFGEDVIFSSDEAEVPFVHGFGFISAELYGTAFEYSTLAEILPGYSNIRLKKSADTWVVSEIIPIK